MKGLLYRIARGVVAATIHATVGSANVEHINMKNVIVGLGFALGMVGLAHACSCFRTATFREQIPRTSLVAEVRVTRVPSTSQELEAILNSMASSDVAASEQPRFYADAEVLRIFKGDEESTKVRLDDSDMCFKSLYVSEMQRGAIYLLALFRPEPQNTVERESSTAPHYDPGGCAETALLREGDELFTFVRDKATGYKPTKKFYAKYADFVKSVRATTPPTPRSRRDAVKPAAR